jgi:hypothetical protein
MAKYWSDLVRGHVRDWLMITPFSRRRRELLNSWTEARFPIPILPSWRKPLSMSELATWKFLDHSDRSACVGSIDVARHTGPTAAMNPINPRSVTTAAMTPPSRAS